MWTRLRYISILAVCLMLLCGCVGTGSHRGVAIVTSHQSYTNPADVQAILENGTRERVYMDPSLSKPIGFCEKLETSGKWFGVGEPYDVQIRPEAWLDSIGVLPRRTIELHVDCETEDPFDLNERYNIIARWLRLSDSEYYHPFREAERPSVRAAIHGTFRVRTSYTSEFWHFQQDGPKSLQEIVSEPFRIDTAAPMYREKPTRDDIARNRAKWNALGFREYTLYWFDHKESDGCRGVFLEFENGSLVTESTFRYGELSPEGCCEDDSADCLERFGDVVERQYRFLEKFAGDELFSPEVEFNQITGLPTHVVYGKCKAPIDHCRYFGRHDVLMLIEPAGQINRTVRE